MHRATLSVAFPALGQRAGLLRREPVDGMLFSSSTSTASSLLIHGLRARRRRRRGASLRARASISVVVPSFRPVFFFSLGVGDAHAVDDVNFLPHHGSDQTSSYSGCLRYREVNAPASPINLALFDVEAHRYDIVPDRERVQALYFSRHFPFLWI